MSTSQISLEFTNRVKNYYQVLDEVKRMIWPSQRQFCKKIGLSQCYLSMIVNQEKPISPKFLKLLGYRKLGPNRYASSTYDQTNQQTLNLEA